MRQKKKKKKKKGAKNSVKQNSRISHCSFSSKQNKTAFFQMYVSQTVFLAFKGTIIFLSPTKTGKQEERKTHKQTNKQTKNKEKTLQIN